MILLHVTTVPQSLAFLRGHIAYAVSRGMGVHVVSSPGQSLVDFGQRESIPVHPVEMPRRISIREDLVALARLFLLIRRIHPILVHSHTPKGGLLGTIAAWLARTPVRVYHIRGLPYMTVSGRRRRVLMATERISCRLAHRVFCVSHSIRDIAIADGVCPAEKIVVFGGGSGNGVDAKTRFNPMRFAEDDVKAERNRWGAPRGALVLLFVGRMVRDKGVEELAAAWSQLREKFPDAWLVVAGPAEPQDPVSPRSLAALESDGRVVLTGQVEDTSRLYAMADLVVLPTYREGFPNVLLEAAAMGLPVVATDIPGCRDAVRDGITGTLVPPMDPESLSVALARYLEDGESRKRHGVVARERVIEQFGQERIWQAMYEEYQRLLRVRGVDVTQG